MGLHLESEIWIRNKHGFVVCYLTAGRVAGVEDQTQLLSDGTSH